MKNVGVISYLLRHHPTAMAMEILRDMGFSCVELDFRHSDGLCDYTQADAADAEKVRSLVESYGITPLAYCVGGFNADRAVHLRRVFEFAKGLGVSTITGVLSPDVLEPLDALCQEYQIRYAIENHKGDAFENAGHYLERLKDCSPYIGVNVDSGHFATAGLDPVDEIRKLEALGGRIYHVHFKDSDQRVDFGQGDVDLKAVYQELQRQNYDGMISIEHYEYPEITDDELRRGLAVALDHVKTIVGS